jgi:hypothetical protein
MILGRYLGMLGNSTVVGVVSPVDLIGYHLFRKQKPKFSLLKMDYTLEAVASSFEHSHALDMLNGQRTP